MSDQLISLREYARRRGVSHSSVRRAVRSGRITTINGKIDPARADIEWAENTDLTKPRNSVTGVPKMVRDPVGPAEPMDLEGHAEIDPSPVPSGPGSARTFAKARTAREGYEARIAKVKYERLTGQLISADEVRVAAFNRARRTRDLLLALPDRLAPVLSATKTSEECHRILTEELTRICEELTRVTS
jgi:hypothetical protein